MNSRKISAREKFLLLLIYFEVDNSPMRFKIKQAENKNKLVFIKANHLEDFGFLLTLLVRSLEIRKIGKELICLK